MLRRDCPISTFAASQARHPSWSTCPVLGSTETPHTTLVSGTPFLIGIGFWSLMNALTWPGQRESALSGVKSVRYRACLAVACTEGTAAEAKVLACSRILPKMSRMVDCSVVGSLTLTQVPLPFWVVDLS